MDYRPSRDLFDQWVRIRVFVPKANAASIRAALDQLAERFGCQGLFVGTLGNYDAVRYEAAVVEHFIPNRDRGANPHVDTPPELVCLETWCSPGIENDVAAHLRACHPYEHPVIETSVVWLTKPKSAQCGGHIV